MHVEVLKYHVALSVGKGIRGLHAIDLSYNNVKRGKTRNACDARPKPQGTLFSDNRNANDGFTKFIGSPMTFRV